VRRVQDEVRMEQVSKGESEKCGPSRSHETFDRLLFIIELLRYCTIHFKLGLFVAKMMSLDKGAG
jgi:hypothetical protein